MVYLHLAQRGRYWIVIDPPGSINRTQSPVPTQIDVARITPLPHFQAKNGLPGTAVSDPGGDCARKHGRQGIV